MCGSATYTTFIIHTARDLEIPDLVAAQSGLIKDSSSLNVETIYTKVSSVSEWLNLRAFLGTADSEVHIVHISHVIIAYTLESLSSLT